MTSRRGTGGNVVDYKTLRRGFTPNLCLERLSSLIIHVPTIAWPNLTKPITFLQNVLYELLGWCLHMNRHFAIQVKYFAIFYNV